MEPTTLIDLASVLAWAAPILFAVIGETVTEKAGVINLSLNGTILLCAMGGFVVAFDTNRILSANGGLSIPFLGDTITPTTVGLLLGFLAGMLIGALVAAVVAFSSITLRMSQVAVGFVLALLCRDLSYFLGSSYMNLPGISLGKIPIPLLKDIPILGPLFFQQNVITYLSFLLIILTWFWIYRTRPGLMLRGIGERPAAAFVRGANITRLRYLYTILGGAIIGIAGPAYSLNVKAGWMGYQSGLDGFGWIALSITIFGGWSPFRAAFGAYLFAFLNWLGLVLQDILPGIPPTALQVAPFPLMILTLLLVNITNAEWVDRMLASWPEELRHIATKLLRAMRASPPASLGVPFDSE